MITDTTGSKEIQYGDITILVNAIVYIVTKNLTIKKGTANEQMLLVQMKRLHCKCKSFQISHCCYSAQFSGFEAHLEYTYHLLFLQIQSPPTYICFLGICRAFADGIFQAKAIVSFKIASNIPSSFFLSNSVKTVGSVKQSVPSVAFM